MDVARIKADNHFLYLVDREKMNHKDYVPIMIQNPRKNVLSDSVWLKEIEKYRIQLDSYTPEN